MHTIKTNLFTLTAYGLVFASSLVLSASAGVLVDDFNAARSYPPCCGEYGSYWAFESNVFQFGTNGSVLIGGSATDNGGLYRDQGGEILWNFTAQSNLLVTARILEGNQATNFIILFRDSNFKCLLFYFPFSPLNTTNFTTLVKPLSAPDWTDATAVEPFDFSNIISWDIYGEFTEDDQPIRFEIDSVELEGPTVTGSLQMRYEIVDGTLILAWPTNLEGGFLLQSVGSLPGYWSNEWAITIVSNEYRFSQSMTNGSQFYRLLATEELSGQYSFMGEQDWLAAVETAKPVFERVEVSQFDLPAISPFPPYRRGCPGVGVER